MNRSTDMPFADDPLAEDLLLAELHDARPQPPADLLDPHSPANRAFLQAIFLPAPPSRLRSRRKARLQRAFVASAVAAAAITVGVVVAWPFSPAPPSAADVVRQAAAASDEALDSGRAEVTVETEVTRDLPDHVEVPADVEEIWALDSGKDIYDYRLAGDDVSVQMAFGVDREDGGYAGERRVVDGEMYWHAGPDPSMPWFQIVDDAADRSDWSGDPRSLFLVLEPRAGFELVGEEAIDGARVRHLRASTPTYYSAEQLGLGQAGGQAAGPVKALEIWVDDDGVVRRIDLETSRTDEGQASFDESPGFTYTYTTVNRISVRFTDLGVPNDIEVPSDICGITEDELTTGITAPPGSQLPC